MRSTASPSTSATLLVAVADELAAVRFARSTGRDSFVAIAATFFDGFWRLASGVWRLRRSRGLALAPKAKRVAKRARMLEVRMVSGACR